MGISSRGKKFLFLFFSASIRVSLHKRVKICSPILRTLLDWNLSSSSFLFIFFHQLVMATGDIYSAETDKIRKKIYQNWGKYRGKKKNNLLGATANCAFYCMYNLSRRFWLIQNCARKRVGGNGGVLSLEFFAFFRQHERNVCICRDNYICTSREVRPYIYIYAYMYVYM